MIKVYILSLFFLSMCSFADDILDLQLSIKKLNRTTQEYLDVNNYILEKILKEGTIKPKQATAALYQLEQINSKLFTRLKSVKIQKAKFEIVDDNITIKKDTSSSSRNRYLQRLKYFLAINIATVPRDLAFKYEPLEAFIDFFVRRNLIVVEVNTNKNTFNIVPTSYGIELSKEVNNNLLELIYRSDITIHETSINELPTDELKRFISLGRGGSTYPSYSKKHSSFILLNKMVSKKLVQEKVTETGGHSFKLTPIAQKAYDAVLILLYKSTKEFK